MGNFWTHRPFWTHGNNTMKERVSLSKRPLKDGVISLFLDYRINGERRRENLKLYLYPERTSLDRTKNLETMRVAKAERDAKAFELEQVEAGVVVKSRPTLAKFVDCDRRYVENLKKANSIRTHASSINLALADNPNVYAQEMDESWFKRFISKLTKRGQKANTINRHVQNVMLTLRQAKSDGLISELPQIKRLLPKKEKVIRDYFTIDEIRLLDTTECEKPLYKQAFLFACFTGLRYSDLCNLQPSMIGNDMIIIRQRKTAEPVRIPLTENAKKYLPDGWKDMSYIFKLPDPNALNYVLKIWAKKAGLTKNIHVHVARHSFATNLISAGADLYVTSKLLGHTSIATTQVYAHMVDEARKKAIDLIPKI